MTTIAWDGKELAADKQATYQDKPYRCTKIAKRNGMLYGVAGYLSAMWPLIEWHAAGCDPDAWPCSAQSDEKEDDDETVLLVIAKDRILIYQSEPNPAILDVDQPFAIGSGQDYAMAAMKLGKSSADAVRVAAEIDCGTGCGVDTLLL
jgi:ATP-dependent protease HslVU (ClpYQ) peptidase subunit